MDNTQNSADGIQNPVPIPPPIVLCPIEPSLRELVCIGPIMSFATMKYGWPEEVLSTLAGFMGHQFMYIPLLYQPKF